MAVVQFGFGGYHVLTKVALNGGANQIVFCVLRNALALFVLAPIAFFQEKYYHHPPHLPLPSLLDSLAYEHIRLGCLIIPTLQPSRSCSALQTIIETVQLFSFALFTISTDLIDCWPCVAWMSRCIDLQCRFQGDSLSRIGQELMDPVR
ncbi:hypothetical protein ACLOJK_003521 [Asimina triloba]